MSNFANYIRTLIGNDLIFGVTVSIVIILLSLFLAKLISFLLKEIIKPFVQKTKSNIDDKILEVVESATFRLIILGVTVISCMKITQNRFLRNHILLSINFYYSLTIFFTLH